MNPVLHPSTVSRLVRVLPAALVKVLDAWSYRVAQRRAQQRQRQWLARKAASGL